MKFALPVLAALAVGKAAAQDQCFEKYQCTFHHNVGTTEYSWDLHQLCRGPGQEYAYVDSQNQTYSLNICGNTSSICAPNYPLYDSVGVAVKTWTDAPYCNPGNTGCYNWDTGAQVCCTGNCAVLGTEFFLFTLMDPANPLKGGVKMVHVGMPPE